ncbi:fimbrial protein [Rahnella sp. PCH160]|uniref:fimbrial protein n=1 Tax=Rahnella sp. PCH160 TaxID=3447928 RepID=UPI0039FC3B0D
MYYSGPLFLFILFWSLFSNASVNSDFNTNQGSMHGRATLQGSIINSACAIDFNSRDQTLSLGVVTAAEIEQFGHGAETIFTINFINCSLTTNSTQTNWNYLRVTFEGDIFDDDLFGIDGGATGFGVSIRDNYGKSILPGHAITIGATEVDGSGINYHLRLEKDKNPLQAGNYHSVIRYKLDYF